jgi:hypothetical protein
MVTTELPERLEASQILVGDVPSRRIEAALFEHRADEQSLW